MFVSTEITITDPVIGETFRPLEGTGFEGMNRVHWDLRGDVRRPGGGGGSGPIAFPGVYHVGMSVDGDEHVTTVTVLEDVWRRGR